LHTAKLRTRGNHYQLPITIAPRGSQPTIRPESI